MNRKVIYAKLYEGFFVPGTGNLKDTLPPDNKTLKDLSMEQDDSGSLLIRWTDVDKSGQFVTRSCRVGAASVKVATFPDEEYKPVSEK